MQKLMQSSKAVAKLMQIWCIVFEIYEKNDAK